MKILIEKACVASRKPSACFVVIIALICLALTMLAAAKSRSSSFGVTGTSHTSISPDAIIPVSVPQATPTPTPKEKNPVQKLFDKIYYAIMGEPGGTVKAEAGEGTDMKSDEKPIISAGVQIAPLTLNPDGKSEGAEPPDSAFTEVDGGIPDPPGGFQSVNQTDKAVDENLGRILKTIYERIGIRPCETDPKDLQRKEGLVDYVDASEVLNPSGERASFGYFIRIPVGVFDGYFSNEGDVEYFTLFSYDKALVTKENKKVPLCASEVFVFGPIARNGPYNRPLRLLLGLAIGADGQRLPAVPLDLARVKNFKSDRKKNEPVKPGVSGQGQGCLVCHGAVDKTPQHTTPFPWMRLIGDP